MNGLLITGTDTGVGKTVVACGLAADLVRRGLRIAVWKPAETGWDESAETTSDAARLRRAAGSTEPLELICPYRLKAPLAPAVAARLEGVSIDIAHLARLCRTRGQSSDLLIVEGAGGLLVPLVRRATYADLARDLGLSLLIVAANRLGAVNHTALTARVATDEGLRVIGFVLNDTQGHAGSHDRQSATTPSDTAARGAAPHLQGGTCRPRDGRPGYPTTVDDPSTATNLSTIAELTGLQCFGEIPYDPKAVDAPERVAAHLDTAGIVAALT